MSKKKTTEEFVQEANIVHKNKYSYSKTLYKTALTKVTITCHDHGEFDQTPNSHLLGSGCPSCGVIKAHKKTLKTKEAFVQEASEIHDNSYDYSSVVYKGADNKVTISCELHGNFEQTPSSHLQGRGCPKCAKLSTGWHYSAWKNRGKLSKYFESYKVYVIECWNDTERFIKIGKTFKSVGNRFHATSKMPYQWKLINTYIGDPKYICELEASLHATYKNNRYTPSIEFKGTTECFSLDIVSTLETTINNFK